MQKTQQTISQKQKNPNKEWLLKTLRKYSDQLGEGKEKMALQNFVDLEQISEENTVRRLSEIFNEISAKKLQIGKMPNRGEYDKFDKKFTKDFVKLLNKFPRLVPEKQFNMKPFEIDGCTAKFLDKEEILAGKPFLLGLVTHCCLTLDRTGAGYVAATALTPYTNILNITKGDGTVLACILTWQNEKGNMVLDTIDVAKMPNKKDKIKPDTLLKIVNEVREQILEENANINSVHLGIGGETIKNLLSEEKFKELAQFGISRDNIVSFFSESFHEKSNHEKEEIMHKISDLLGIHLQVTDQANNITIENDPLCVTRSTEVHQFDSSVQCNVSERKEEHSVKSEEESKEAIVDSKAMLHLHSIGTHNTASSFSKSVTHGVEDKKSIHIHAVQNSIVKSHSHHQI